MIKWKKQPAALKMTSKTKTKSMSQNLSPPEKKIGQWNIKSQKVIIIVAVWFYCEKRKENVHKNETWIFTLDMHVAETNKKWWIV